MNKLIFVYGTLKSGYGNNHLITRCSKSVLCDVGETNDPMLFSNSGIPYMYRTRFDGTLESVEYQAPVVGEVWRIRSQEVMDNLDRLEGHPHGYRREPLTVNQLRNNTEIYECEGYFYQHNMKLTQPNHQIGEKYYHSWPNREYVR